MNDAIQGIKYTGKLNQAYLILKTVLLPKEAVLGH